MSTKTYNNFFQRIKKLFTSIDFIGPNFTLQNADSDRFQSIQGSFWSILCGVLLVVSGFMFGKEIYERKIPRTSTNRENIQYADIYFKDFPLMFTLITPSGRVLTNDTFRRYLEPFVTKINYDINGTLHLTENALDYTPCTADMFPNYYDYVNEELSKHTDDRYLCLNFQKDDFFSNTIFAINSTNYNIGLKKCTVNCAEDKEEVIKDILLDVTYITSFVDLKNYQNPISRFLEHLTTQLDWTLFRRSYMRFVYNKLELDYGWFIDDVEEISVPYLESLVPDDLAIIERGIYNNAMFILSVESPKSRMVFTRSYFKIQELLANLGGLSNFFILAVKVLSDSHLRFIMYFFIKRAAISSLEKFDLENSISQNLKSKKVSSKQLGLKTNSMKVTKFEAPNAVNPHEGKAIDESSCVEMKREMDNPVQTVIRLENNKVVTPEGEDMSPAKVKSLQNYTNKNEEKSSKRVIVESNKEVNKRSSNDSMNLREQLKIMKTKLSFFSPSVIQKLNKESQESYATYLVSIICCRGELKRYYKVQLKAIRKLISIHTFTNLIISNANQDEYEVYDSMRVYK